MEEAATARGGRERGFRIRKKEIGILYGKEEDEEVNERRGRRWDRYLHREARRLERTK